MPLHWSIDARMEVAVAVSTAQKANDRPAVDAAPAPDPKLRPRGASPLRLNILSDLHLSRGDLPLPETDADIVILAGDLARPEQAMAWARRFTRPVLYVAGNHEFYGGSLSGTMGRLKALARGTNVRVLDREEVILQGVRFLGTTLWTDFMLYGDSPQREETMAKVAERVRDFTMVASMESPGELYSPEESTHVFARDRDWLAGKLSEPFAGPTVVITHHAPARGSIHPRFEGSPFNLCFVSDLEYLMGADRVALWIHGHTHDSFDYQVRGTRVVCNPRGYFKDGANENRAFDPQRVVAVG